MRKPITADKLVTCGNHLAQLVSGKARQIYREYEQLLIDGTWLEEMIQLSEFNQADACRARELAAAHLRRCLAGFERRIVRRCEQKPLVLLRMAEQPRHINCPERRRLAFSIMSTDAIDRQPTEQ